MKPREQRVIDEKTELDDKLNKLNAFTQGDTFVKLEWVDAHLLYRQSRVMQEYSDILGQRIARFLNSDNANNLQ